SSWLLNVIYFFDLPNNLFPSIHSLKSWLCFAAVRDERRVPAWFKGFSFVLAVLICVSTLYTKQHVAADALAGVFVAEVFWQLAPVLGFNKVYVSLNEIIHLPR
ncbi:MAG: phosphatase PAP2 family protein, partial [Lachnospiraceae bacterium]|nr:phosphatase PAP2 family protein [Lachnospiraceae bacterium]